MLQINLFRSSFVEATLSHQNFVRQLQTEFRHQCLHDPEAVSAIQILCFYILNPDDIVNNIILIK